MNVLASLNLNRHSINLYPYKILIDTPCRIFLECSHIDMLFNKNIKSIDSNKVKVNIINSNKDIFSIKGIKVINVKKVTDDNLYYDYYNQINNVKKDSHKEVEIVLLKALSISDINNITTYFKDVQVDLSNYAFTQEYNKRDFNCSFCGAKLHERNTDNRSDIICKHCLEDMEY